MLGATYGAEGGFIMESGKRRARLPSKPFKTLLAGDLTIARSPVFVLTCDGYGL